MGARFWATLQAQRAQFRALQVVEFPFLIPITRITKQGESRLKPIDDTGALGMECA